MNIKYQCNKCGAEGVKLWRQYNTFLDYIKLLCVKCSLEDQGRDKTTVREDGMISSKYGWTDQIGNLIPAVPTIENDTFWGYTSVPQDRVDWWKELPLT